MKENQRYMQILAGARSWLAVMILLLLTAVATTAQPKAQGVSVLPNEAARRVDILVDGRPFTAYIWPETQKKPVLYPLNAADGTPVTRGFPLEPRPGERVDHPHHVVSEIPHRSSSKWRQIRHWRRLETLQRASQVLHEFLGGLTLPISAGSTG